MRRSVALVMLNLYSAALIASLAGLGYAIALTSLLYWHFFVGTDMSDWLNANIGHFYRGVALLFGGAATRWLLEKIIARLCADNEWLAAFKDAHEYITALFPEKSRES